jgi:hypothetical protein
VYKGRAVFWLRLRVAKEGYHVVLVGNFAYWLPGLFVLG